MAIHTHPASQAVTPGGNVVFSVSGAGAPSGIQWFHDGTPILAATGASLALTNAQPSFAGAYRVDVTNSAGTVSSNVANLTVLASALPNQTVTLGHAVSFLANGASGSFQWQVSSDGSSFRNLANDTGVSGATSALLELGNVAASANGFRYRYINSVAGGSTTSNPATLAVQDAFVPHPTSIGTDSAGNLYVGDASTNTVQKISPALQITTLAGTGGAAGSADGSGPAARFNQPNGIAVAGDGTLFVADTANGTIRRISVAGVVTTLAGSGAARGNADGTGAAARFNFPVAIAADGAGNLFVADTMNHTVRRVTPAGVVTTFAGSPGSAGTADGMGLTARFNQPTGLAADAAGNVYVADTTNNTIRKISPLGAVTTLAGLAGVSGSADGAGSAALFNHPGGLAVDASGNIFVADTGNSTIRKITPAGLVTTLAGVATVGGLTDGVGSAVFFNQPAALAVDASGNLFVADTSNATLRKVTSAGVVTTLALTAGPAPVSAPTTPAPATPAPAPAAGGGGGGGGGAPGGWFLAALSLLALGRRGWRRRGPR
ncbi:MAG: SMP-30/gluconolactonase/LRE family protein [Opitutae bacterium]|nr:SMP-30/gluconolactonase/LRE family protein [Opitutae bacterium]